MKILNYSILGGNLEKRQEQIYETTNVYNVSRSKTCERWIILLFTFINKSSILSWILLMFAPNLNANTVIFYSCYFDVFLVRLPIYSNYFFPSLIKYELNGTKQFDMMSLQYKNIFSMNLNCYEITINVFTRSVNAVD